MEIDLEPHSNLEVTKVIAPTTVAAGTVAVDFTVVNFGSVATACSSHWTDAVYLSLTDTVSAVPSVKLGEYANQLALGPAGSPDDKPSHRRPAR